MKKFHFILIICALFCAGALLAGCSDSLVVSSGGGGGGGGSSSSSTSGGGSSGSSSSTSGGGGGSSGVGSVSDSAGGGTDSSYDNSSYSLSGTVWTTDSDTRTITLNFISDDLVYYTEPEGYITGYSYTYNSYGYNDGSGTAYVADTAVLFSVSGSTLTWGGLTFYQNY